MHRLSTTFVWWILTSLFLCSCTETEEFKSLESGNKWRLLSFTNTEELIDSAGVVYIDGFILNPKSGDTLNSFYSEPFQPGWDDCWKLLRKRYTGDSLQFVSTHGDFLHPTENLSDTLTYFLRIDRMRTKRELKSDRVKELSVLDEIVRADSVQESYREIAGIYFNSLSKRDTVRVLNGRELMIHYKGYTLEGRVFDDSRRMNSPLVFVMGNDNQVIPGLEIALEQMHRREKARVIIPSWLGFGAKGSAGGHVPPYTTVVYEVEVLKIGV